MKQNFYIDSPTGKVLIALETCIECKSFNFCYKDSYGNFHHSTPNGICQDCLKNKKE